MEPNNQLPNPNTSYGAGPDQPATSPAPSDNFSPGKSNKTKKIVIIGAIAIILLLTIVGVVASLSGNKKKKTQDTSQAAQPAELTRNPSAIDVEDINNSINASITGLDDEKDFPEANLNDKSLEL